MTRINLINPAELVDQHLIAEYRELPRIFGAIRKKLKNNKEIKVGKEYKMGIGHVIFFYDKLGFLEKRYYEIVKECKKRGFNIKFDSINLSDVPKKYKKDFFPSPKDIRISESRIKEKLKSKKGFYKMRGKII
ncbi:endonuclease [Candidatus Gracilibacteria bacterium]|nr:MAG: endonuclease [Candidatus Gracilibacteria bacterium]PIE85195.1 MAG: endonuclease [Candidatus Gracilibacteria bacterium]